MLVLVLGWCLLCWCYAGRVVLLEDCWCALLVFFIFYFRLPSVFHSYYVMAFLGACVCIGSIFSSYVRLLTASCGVVI